MKQIKISDTTLCRENATFSFKEKLEIARQLEKLRVDVIELPEISNVKTDVLLVRTISSFVKNSVISVAAGIQKNSIQNAVDSLSAAKFGRIRIELPVSAVLMEYTCHKKPDKMLGYITESISKAKQSVEDVEFCAIDATRADKEFLVNAISAAVEAGASSVSLCDSTGEKMPDDFAAFINEMTDGLSVPVGVKCDNKNALALAQAILAVRTGATTVKTAVGGNTVELEAFATMIKNCGESYGFKSGVEFTVLNRTIGQIDRISGSNKGDVSVSAAIVTDENNIYLDAKDDQETVIAATAKLGYDLSEEDQAKVFEEFIRAAEKKKVGAKELDAIVASVSLQVPATYTLKSYVINNGNIINATAQLTMIKNGDEMQGMSIGDGPIDAAFKAIDNIIGHHYELDDFQIQSVTQGKEAMGSALVKLRANGKVYSGKGISTDIMGASIRAYINAINKIVYEEAN